MCCTCVFVTGGFVAAQEGFGSSGQPGTRSWLPQQGRPGTVGAMLHGDQFAFLSAGPMARIRILLTVRTNERGHGPESFSCETCRRRWEESLEIIRSRMTDMARVRSISNLWPDGHVIEETCGSCEGCRTELDAAARTAVLAEAKVDTLITQGPAHNAITSRRGCSACRRWLTVRTNGAAQLRASGFSPERWLPSLETGLHTH